MGATLNERKAIKDDVENRMSLPEIGIHRQLLLVYEGSKELENVGLRDRIIKFLLAYEVKVAFIEVHMNSALYIKIPNPFNDLMLRKLATDFEEFISALEEESKGRIFWLFNTVAQLKFDEPQSIRAATVGKGNKTIYEEVKAQIDALPKPEVLPEEAQDEKESAE